MGIHHSDFDQRLRGFSPVHLGKMPVDLPPAQGSSIAEQLEQALLCRAIGFVTHNERGRVEAVQHIRLLAEAGREHHADHRCQRVECGF